MKLTNCFPKCPKHFVFPPTMNTLLLLQIFASFGAVSVWNFGHSNRCVVVLHCCFNVKLLDNLWCWPYFQMLICHLYICFERCVFRSLFFLTPLKVVTLLSLYTNNVGGSTSIFVDYWAVLHWLLLLGQPKSFRISDKEVT